MVKVKGIFDLIKFHLKLANDSVLLNLLSLLSCELLLHFFVFCLQLSLHLESLFDLRKLLLQLERLNIALGLPLIIHEQAQTLRIKLIGLIANDLL